MSYQYSVTERRRRTTGAGSSGNRSAFGYWVPLVITVTAATIGFAAWIWSERRDDEEESEVEHLPGGVPPPGYASMSGGLPPGPGPAGFQGPPVSVPGPAGYSGPPPPGWQGQPPPDFQGSREEYSARSTNFNQQEESGLVARMSSALGIGRSASPMNSVEWAGKTLSAGVAAAGAMVGGALSSFREDGQKEYADHERWSEEADQRDNQQEIKQGLQRRGTADEFFSGNIEIPRQSSLNRRKRKSVAIVVSAVGLDNDGMEDVGYHAVS